MPFKTILAIVQSFEDIDRVTDCAAALAARFDGHLIGLHSEALPMAYTSAVGLPDPEFIQMSGEFNRERAQKLEARFRERVSAEGLSFEWRSFESFTGDSAQCGISSARCADLVVAAQGSGQGGSAAVPDLDALLYEAGRPLLVTPLSGPSLSTFRRVVIGWNGSRELARAAFDALPFLVEADWIEILVIDPPEGKGLSEAGSDIAAALARHGAEITVHTEASRGVSTETAIQNRLAETGADLVVLGAYSHSWLRELLFGGVTRAMLKSLPVTAFLSR